MMLMGYWSCAVQPGTAMTAHGDDEVRRHKGCRTFLLRPRAPRPSDPELPHAEANLPTRYPTHRKQRGGKQVEEMFVFSLEILHRGCLPCTVYRRKRKREFLKPLVERLYRGNMLEIVACDC